jgi:hypothetical protein
MAYENSHGLLERRISEVFERVTDSGHKLREPIAWLYACGMNHPEFTDGIVKARAEAVLTGDVHQS